MQKNLNLLILVLTITITKIKTSKRVLMGGEWGNDDFNPLNPQIEGYCRIPGPLVEKEKIIIKDQIKEILSKNDKLSKSTNPYLTQINNFEILPESKYHKIKDSANKEKVENKEKKLVEFIYNIIFGNKTVSCKLDFTVYGDGDEITLEDLTKCLVLNDLLEKCVNDLDEAAPLDGKEMVNEEIMILV